MGILVTMEIAHVNNMSHTTSHDFIFTDRHPESPAGEPADRTCLGRNPCPNVATRNCKDKDVGVFFVNYLAVHTIFSWVKCSVPAHDVPQLLQVFQSEVPVLSVTASDVFVNAM